MIGEALRVAKRNPPCYEHFTMELLRLSPDKIDWSLDFAPLKPWPQRFPVLCVRRDNRLCALTGFDRKDIPTDSSGVECLVLDKKSAETLSTLVDEIYPFHQRGALEGLRLQKVLGLEVFQGYLLEMPLEFQKFLDQKQMALKTLKPLEHLTEWKQEVAQSLINLNPTSSQIREILDLLSDLRFLGKSWTECSPAVSHGPGWLQSLKTLRNPRTVAGDDQSQKLLQQVAWPKGVHAKWERAGDLAGIVIQTRINNPVEWNRLKENLLRVDLGEKIWS